MTSRDKVINTIYKQIYQPIPVFLAIPENLSEERAPECAELRRRFRNDMEFLDYTHFPFRNLVNYVDPWGCVWKKDEMGRFQNTSKPVCDRFDKLNDLPIRRCPVGEKEIDHVNRLCESSSKFMVAQVPLRMLERLQTLLGREMAIQGVRKMQRDVRTFLDRLYENYFSQLEIWCRSDVDAICLEDCWATDEGLGVSTDRWEDVFGAHWDRFLKKIRESDKFVYFYSDGNFEACIPNLIRKGVDVIRYNSARMNSRTLAEKYGSQVAFHAVFPIQDLRETSEEAISQEILDIRYAFSNGTPLIAECRFDRTTPFRNITTAMLNWQRRLPPPNEQG